jgi:acetylornithine deacetylase/succinyl-diaminopimelate desuccinylase-like protein
MDARVTDRAEAWLRANRERLWEEYKDLVRIPSISAKPDHAGEVRRAADWVAARCAKAGLTNVQTLEAGGHPSVYAEWLGAPGAPTILVYAHFDVQPPEPLELWDSPAFEPTLRDGRLYARGSSDDKATLFISLAAIEAWMATAGSLPCNVKVFYEGEEEVGSPTLSGILDRHGALLSADLCLSADGGMMLADKPDVSVGNRGICKLEFTLRTAAKDMHSGSFGGAILNPLVAIANVVSRLHEADGRVAVPHFYDGVRETTERDRAELAAVPFDEAAWLAGVGAKGVWGERTRSVLEKLWLRPTLEINGMWGGYQGAGSKTVLPCEAHAKITCRLVPGQNPRKVQAAVEAYLRAICPEGADIEVRQGGGGAAAYEIAPDHPALATIEGVLEGVYGQPCFRTRIGGTLPLCAVFKERLGLDTVPMSFSTGDEDYHAPNEFFREASFDRGLTAWARVYQALASLKS